MTAKICRICGSRDNLKLIWDGGEALLERLRICVNIKVNFGDNLPEHICQHCENGLEFSYYFRMQGEETEKRLRSEMQVETVTSKSAADSDFDGANDTSDFEEFVMENNDENTIVKQEYTLKKQIDYEDEIDNNTIIVKNEPDDDPNIVVENEKIENYTKNKDYDAEEEEEDEEEEEEEEEEAGFDQQQPVNKIELDEYNVATIQYSIDLMPPSQSLPPPPPSTEIEDSLLQELTTNKSTSNSRKDLYTCPTCQQVLPTQSEYRLHIKEHGKERFNCIQCNKWFPSRFRLRQHEQIHIIDVEMHKCSLCDRSYRLRYNLTRHIRSVHENQKSFKCEFCKESFSRADVYKIHINTHKDERYFQCPQCNESFKTQRYLDSHLKIHEPKKVDRFSQNNSNENSCNSNDETNTKRTYYCIHCGKESKQHYAHKNHLRTHSEERPYSCESCPKKFRTMAALMTHERIHTDTRPYQCDICLVSFRQHSHLRDHRLVHAGIKQHVCSICNTAFTKKSNLNAHMRVHTGERPYRCTICDKSFTRSSLLKRHKQNVHGLSLELINSIDGKMPTSGESENTYEGDDNDFENENDNDNDNVNENENENENDDLTDIGASDEGMDGRINGIVNLTNYSNIMLIADENIHVSSLLNDDNDYDCYDENDEIHLKNIKDIIEQNNIVIASNDTIESEKNSNGMKYNVSYVNDFGENIQEITGTIVNDFNNTNISDIDNSYEIANEDSDIELTDDLIKTEIAKKLKYSTSFKIDYDNLNDNEMLRKHNRTTLPDNDAINDFDNAKVMKHNYNADDVVILSDSSSENGDNSTECKNYPNNNINDITNDANQHNDDDDYDDGGSNQGVMLVIDDANFNSLFIMDDVVK